MRLRSEARQALFHYRNRYTAADVVEQCDNEAAVLAAIDRLAALTASIAPAPQAVVGEAIPEPVARVLRYAGKTLRDVRNPNLTARETIVLADWIRAALTPPAPSTAPTPPVDAATPSPGEPSGWTRSAIFQAAKACSAQALDMRANSSVQVWQGHADNLSAIVEAIDAAAPPVDAVPGEPEVYGLPFSEARRIILDMDAESARGMAISLLIQLNIANKYAAPTAPEAVPGEPAAWLTMCGPTTGCGVQYAGNLAHCPNCGKANFGRPAGTTVIVAASVAPRVAGEPVAWQADKDRCREWTDSRISAEHWGRHGWRITPLYAAPVASRAVSEPVAEIPEHWPTAWRDVLLERHRQTIKEGWTAHHDDEHSSGSMALAAACCACNAATWSQRDTSIPATDYANFAAPGFRWPWAMKWWKPKSQRQDLVRAGALILAEIERLDRKEMTK